MQIETSTTIDRPPSDVFRFVGHDHFANHPRWDLSVLEMTPLTPGPIGAGSKARVRRKRGSEDEILEVLDFEPERLWRSRDNVGPFLLTMTALVDPLGEDASRLTLESDVQTSGPARVAAPLLRPVFRRQMRRSLARIKAMVEAESSGAV